MENAGVYGGQPEAVCVPYHAFTDGRRRGNRPRNDPHRTIYSGGAGAGAGGGFASDDTGGDQFRLELLGGLSVPLFAFLLVEGFRNTSDYRRYLLTMVGFALAEGCEVP